jgi:hypothetical protein
MTKQGLLATLVAGVASLLLLSTATAAVSTTIDFEGLAEGSTVSSLSSGNGISGPAVSGSIAVFADRNGSDGAVNDAMIFDATCGGGPAGNCTGGDTDLFQPTQGNVLIISQDGDGDDPDDALQGGTIELDFSSFDGGPVYVDTIQILDTDAPEQGKIELFNGVTLLKTVNIPIIADGAMQTLDIDRGGVDRMLVTFGGSGAIDDIKLETEDEEDDRWMTGGGNITEGRGRNAVPFSTHGFIIRCDGSFAQFQYNDHTNGGNFHLEDVTSVVCIDKDLGPQPPATDFDTLVMTGTGTWNGVPGATVVVTMTDQGQPGTNDTFDIVVTVVGEIQPVSAISGNLTVGNHQAH